MSTDFPAWCRELKSENWFKAAEVDVFESYLTENITATEVAEKLTGYTDRALTADSKVGRIWTLLMLCADECSAAHDAIIELIKAIIVIPASKDTGGVDWTDQETSFKELWRDSYDCKLPPFTPWSSFKAAGSLTLTKLALRASIEERSNYQRASTISLPQKWINFHAFTATLASTGVFGDDFAMVSGLEVIVSALEKKSPTAWELEANTPAAIQWLLHATKTIFRNGQSIDTNWGAESELWQGKEGFSRQRWNFWKERLERMHNQDGLDDETKQLARKASVAMSKIERMKS
jgi:hypothetical protein